MDKELQKRAKKLYPDKVTYNLKEAATILGISPRTVYNNRAKYCFGYPCTLSQIEKAITPHAATQDVISKSKSHDMT